MRVNKKHFSIVNDDNWNFSENTIVIVGAALDGPSRVPIIVNDKYSPIDLFGKSPLSDAYTAVKGAGAKKIITYRINGVHSQAIIQSTTDTTTLDVIRLTAISAGQKYNDIAITVYPDYIYIDETAVGGSTRSYFFDQYPTAYDLVYGINRDAYYGLISFTAEQLIPNFPMMNIVQSMYKPMFRDGSDENEFLIDRTTANTVGYYVNNTKQRLMETLFGTEPADQEEFSPNGALASINYGVILLADMYHDESSDYANILGNFCLNKGKIMDSGCIGVIGTSPLYDTSSSSVSVKIQNLIEQNTLMNDEEHDKYVNAEQNKYVQVVIGDSYYSTDMPIVSNAYAYAGTQSFYPYYNIMTNKKLSGFGYLNWQISKEDVALLSANGYICIVPSIRRGFVPYQACTYYKDKTSAMAKPHCIRISQRASKVLMLAYDGFIGSVSNFYTEKDIIGAAKNVLQGMITDGAIQSFSVKCSFTPGDREVAITVSLVPYNELTTINSLTVIAFPKEVIR